MIKKLIKRKIDKVGVFATLCLILFIWTMVEAMFFAFLGDAEKVYNNLLWGLFNLILYYFNKNRYGKFDEGE